MAAHLNIHPRCLVLGGVYGHTDSEPVFVEVPVPTDVKIVAANLEQPVIEKILTQLGPQVRAPPRTPAGGQALEAA